VIIDDPRVCLNPRQERRPRAPKSLPFPETYLMRLLSFLHDNHKRFGALLSGERVTPSSAPRAAKRWRDRSIR
jgi:hypothetical protein